MFLDVIIKLRKTGSCLSINFPGKNERDGLMLSKGKILCLQITTEFVHSTFMMEKIKDILIFPGYFHFYFTQS